MLQSTLTFFFHLNGFRKIENKDVFKEKLTNECAGASFPCSGHHWRVTECSSNWSNRSNLTTANVSCLFCGFTLELVLNSNRKDTSGKQIYIWCRCLLSASGLYFNQDFDIVGQAMKSGSMSRRVPLCSSVVLLFLLSSVALKQLFMVLC